jgi:hypothetical protein
MPAVDMNTGRDSPSDTGRLLCKTWMTSVDPKPLQVVQACLSFVPAFNTGINGLHTEGLNRRLSLPLLTHLRAFYSQLCLLVPYRRLEYVHFEFALPRGIHSLQLTLIVGCIVPSQPGRYLILVIEGLRSGPHRARSTYPAVSP